MSNWDLMMPGMGLTAIGLAGVVLSYADLAHTFIDGMHALSGLTMFVGLIFLAAGILDGGVSTSNRAKATVLVILSIILGFGMFGLTYNTSNFTITLAGILMGIAFPSIIIAYLAMKHPTILKPVGSIVAMSAATGIIMWLAFGFVSPDTYIIPQQAPPEEVAVEEAAAPEGPVFPVEILAGSSVEGTPDYDPDTATVEQGTTVVWTNADDVAHTVTSREGFGELFDSGLMDAGGTFSVDTTGMEPGTHEYFCIVHPWMISFLEVTAPVERPVAAVSMPDGASVVSEGQLYYDPTDLAVEPGTRVVWTNDDTLQHTVTSGAIGNIDGMYDSGLMDAGAEFEYAFDEPGTYEYFCLLHPWMIGTVTVG